MACRAFGEAVVKVGQTFLSALLIFLLPVWRQKKGRFDRLDTSNQPHRVRHADSRPDPLPVSFERSAKDNDDRQQFPILHPKRKTPRVLSTRGVFFIDVTWRLRAFTYSYRNA